MTLPQFRHLQVLWIGTEGIRTIPEDIKNLENVTRLVFLNGDLEGFPSAVCQFNKLTHLALNRYEKIKEIPPAACGKMKTLRRLHIVCQRIWIKWSTLETLNLRGNSLSHLCNGLKNMTKLIS